MILRQHRKKVFIILFAVLAAVSLAAAALICVNMHGMLNARNISELMNARNEPPGNMAGGPAFYEPVATPHFTCILSSAGGVSLFSGYNFLSDKADLAQLVQKALVCGTETDILEEYNLRFSISSYSYDARLITFVDTSAMHREMSEYILTVFLILIPVLALIALFCYHLSGWLVQPVKTMVEEQHRFIAGASHELKTPLAIISSNAELLESMPGEEKASLWCRNIKEECRRMNDLVQGLTFVTLSTTDRKQELKRIDFSDLLEGELTRFEVMAFEKGLAFSVEMEPDIHIQGDRTQLAGLVDILMDNAIKYCREKGAISVRLSRNAGMMRFSVTNDGEPLSPEQCQNVFIPFYRVGPGEGFGLGLSIAWESVSAMGGTIRAMGGKTSNTFQIEFPCEVAR